MQTYYPIHFSFYFFLLQKYLNLILSNEIRLQDKHTALVSTLKHRQNIELVLDFVTNEHEEIAKM